MLFLNFYTFISNVKGKTKPIFVEFGMNKSNIINIKVTKYYIKTIDKETLLDLIL